MRNLFLGEKAPIPIVQDTYLLSEDDLLGPIALETTKVDQPNPESQQKEGQIAT